MKTFVLRSKKTARSRADGFSLVEVTLAVGLMAFSLVGILGVLPLAMDSGRQSFDQARAGAVANTLFASFRSQPFGEVRYLDAHYDANGTPLSGSSADGAPPALNLNVLSSVAGGSTSTMSASPSQAVKFYAKFLDVPTDAGIQNDTLGNQRRLCFTQDQPKEGADYQVVLYFNNTPEGTIIASGGADRVGQANRVTVVVSTPTQDGAPLRNPYRFVTTVANRLN